MEEKVFVYLYFFPLERIETITYFLRVKGLRKEDRVEVDDLGS